MKCPKCKGYGYYEKEEDGIIELIKCECQYTNEEWLKQCNTKELAEFLVMIQMSVMHPVKRGAVDMDKFIEEVVDWLKQQHTKE